MSVTTHTWQSLGIYGLLLVSVGSLFFYYYLGLSRARRRKHAR